MSAEKELIEGFNAGYLLEKHRPELSKQLVEAVDGVDIPFVEGFVAGAKEYAKERIQSKTIAKLRDFSKGHIPKPTKDKTKEDKDKGFELDI